MALKMNLMTIRLLAAAAVVVALAVSPAAAQGGSALCTASLITSFTPCFSFLTNSTNGGSPSRDCCQSLASLVNASTGCACLILTGNVPLGMPVNRTLAVTLPSACNSMAVPLQCRDTSAQMPAPGPVAGAPSAASLPLPPATTQAPPAADPTATAPVSQGQSRPAVLPSSATRRASAHATAAAFVLLLAVGAALV